MDKISISSTEYKRLRRQAEAHKKLVSRFFESVARDYVDEIVGDFKKAKLYSEDFLLNLEEGLRKSSLLVLKVFPAK